ncbi:serine hydrolase domain-containing protein [Paenibacillus sp. JCM 10914]|uniref:serine hydrolase domain-containing protein n=1 Tax=Paenibacillus sp. JCM 10914 TaxID=1236974 RepID=UPI0003CC64B4|nr:serine hydrolase domain-containing protein [Paenibacillus sp. JCM 10914]GAE09292.1 beta-lactamase [Paenibacillus sp. JCM 10914]
MKKRLSRLLVSLLTVSMLIPAGVMAADDSKTGTVGGNLEKIAAEKAALLTGTYGTTSVQYALIDNGTVKLSGQAGVNDAEGTKPLTKDTLYGIGSTSKVFTAVAVMKLVDDGKIDLDTPLVSYIPDFKMKDERYTKITPRMLLNHSSGLQGSSLRNAFLFEDNDTYAHDSLLAQLSTQNLKADPGAYSVYSNDSFTLAEILVERVSGMSYTAFIHQSITKPLEMNNTKTSQEKLDASKLPGLYFPTSPAQLPNEVINVIGTGGIYSTAEDLLKFSTIFTGEATGILSEKSIKAMEQDEYKKGIWPEDADNSLDYGLGWDSVKLFPFNQYDIKAVTKGGDTILYHASLVVLPEQNMAAAVLSSGGSSATNQLLANELLLHALKDNGTIDEFLPEKSFGTPVKADMPSDVSKHAGYYGATNQQMKADITEEGELLITVPIVPEYPAEKYVYTKDGTFVSEDGSIKISFVTEKNERTYMWARQYVAIPELGQLAISQYIGEKLASHEITGETKAAWVAREGKTFYPLNEKYTSLMYLIQKPVLEINTAAGLEGYMLDKKLIDPNTAFSDHQVPGTGSRDTSVFKFYNQDGQEYLEAAGSLFVSEDSVTPLYAGKKSVVTLQPNGHAKWYTVPEAAAGKTMTVKMPFHGAFAVYNEQGICVNFTVASGENTVTLPENGTIVFAGASNSAFLIDLN